MKLYEWLEQPSHQKFLHEHNEALEKAKTREGKRPEQKGSLCRLQRRFKSEQKRHEARSRSGRLKVVFTPPMYPPCTVPTAELQKRLISELEFETRSDSYIIVRVSDPAIETSFVMVIAEDEDGNVVLLRILREFHLCHGGRLDRGMVLLVKQPCLKWMAQKEYEIRVDHVSDVMFVPPFDERVPLSWRHDSLKDVSDWSSEKLADMGDHLSTKGRHHLAVQWYTKALGCSPPPQVAAIIFFCRSNGYYQTHRYEAALHDLEQATRCLEISKHVLRRKAQILYHLGRYQESTKAYKALMKRRPNLPTDQEGLNNALARLAEQQHGQYDFKAMQDNITHSRTLLLDHATYIGPVTQKQRPLHGNGLFTTKAVKAGDLLLVEKAFSFIFSQNRTFPTSNIVQVNTETQFVTNAPTHDLTTKTIQKLTQSPSSLSNIISLHNGSFPKIVSVDKSNSPIIDSFLLTQVTTLNSFGSPITSKAIHADTSDKRIMSTFTSTGIWPAASTINHSCDSNTRRAFMGDIMIVRAARDIPAGAELTWWYKYPSREGVADTRHWGFECGCGICVAAGGLGNGRRKFERELLRGKVWGMVRENDSLARGLLVRKIGVLEGLGHGFGIWDVFFRAAGGFLKAGEGRLAVEFVGRGLGALGFGVDLCFERAVCFVRKWGVVVDEVVEAWVVVYLAFCSVEPGLAGVADRYARLAYLICVGEDDSFDEVYGRKSGRPYGPAELV